MIRLIVLSLVTLILFSGCVNNQDFVKQGDYQSENASLRLELAQTNNNLDLLQEEYEDNKKNSMDVCIKLASQIYLDCVNLSPIRYVDSSSNEIEEACMSVFSDKGNVGATHYENFNEYCKYQFS